MRKIYHPVFNQPDPNPETVFMSIKTIGKSQGSSDASDEVVSEVPSPAEERVRTAIASAKRSAEEARRALEALEMEASDKLGETGEQVIGMIRDKPLQAAGIAFAAGVFATLILSRKS